MLAWGRTQILRGTPECYMTLTHKVKVQVITSQDRSPKIVLRVWMVIWIPPDCNRRSFFLSFQNVLLGHMEPGFLHTSIFDMFEFLGQLFNVFVIVFLFVTWQSMSPHCQDDQMSWYICFEKIKCNNNSWNYQFTFKIIFNSL